MAEFEYKQIEQDRGKICNDLLRALPGWFGIEEAIVQYTKDVESMATFAAFHQGKAVGFVSLNVHSEHTAEIHVMAVHPAHHRAGLGWQLTKRAEEFLRAKNFEFLTVKTLSPARPNKEYELTRKFYAAMGFRVAEEFKTLWGEHNPCLLLIKSL